MVHVDEHRPATADPLLEISNLVVQFTTADGPVRVLDDVSWSVRRGETLVVLGESGSGKSVTARAAMGLLPSPPAEILSGSIVLNGEDLLTLSPARRRALAGTRLSMVFQDAVAGLNPAMKVGAQIAETFRTHEKCTRKKAWERAVQWMSLVGISDAAARAHQYPHQFSGGMSQRVGIAMALAMSPDVLIADEPTTALDVTIQAQILDLLQALQRELGMGLILITHDVAVAAERADTVSVMYAGRIVEQGPVESVMRSPSHPYTAGLLGSVPRATGDRRRLEPIAGLPPDLLSPPTGCKFHPRCPLARERCAVEEPALAVVGAGRRSACFYWEEVSRGA